MELNPSKIITSPLREESTLSNSTASGSNSTSNPSEKGTSESTNSRFSNDGDSSMGRAISTGLNSVGIPTDSAVNSMGPQKIWSVERLIPSHFKNANSFDEILLNIKNIVLDMELGNIIDGSVQKGLSGRDKNEILSRSEIKSESLYLQLVSDDTKKTRVDDNETQSLLQKDMAVGDHTENAEFSDAKLQNDKAACHGIISCAFLLDHPYARPPDQSQISDLQNGDVDMCSDNCTLSQKVENNKRSVTLDNQKLGIDEQVLVSCMEFSKNYMGLKPLSPTSSTSSLTADLASISSCSILSGDESDDNISVGISSPASSNRLYTNSPSILSQKRRFKTRRLTPLNSNGVLPDIHPAFGSETLKGSSDTRVQPMAYPDDTSKVVQRLQSVLHDHDYCSKDSKLFRFTGGSGKLKSFSAGDDSGLFKEGKRKYTKKKKMDGLSEKILKAKYLKKELLKKDSSLKPGVKHQATLTKPAVTRPVSKPVGKHKKRMLQKSIDDEIDPETEKKLKITGKYQDQYVYYLSKSSRTTRRRRQTTASPLTSDKNLAAVPNPGDIVIPHLTDADIEAVRLKGRAALKQSAGPRSTSVSSLFQSVSPFSDHSVEHMSDVDSHIVSTILSMESDSMSYPASPQPSDIMSTSSLNPNQPALTESLRLVSGDPTITSEHVLNYLLSLVKDDGFTDSGYGLETGAPVFYPTVSSDSTDTMVEHAGESEAAFGDTVIIQSVSSGEELLHMADSVQRTSFDNQILHSSTQNHPDCFHPPQSDCVAEASLLDDLSSMLESKEVLFPSVNLNEDADSLVKRTLKPDLSSVELSQATSSVHRLTSIEKTIDYLYRKDDNVFDHTNAESSLVTTTFADDNTPWIVTVTLYFNDVPAVMINNQPYIRLVDIYKQILPAKDTGILKKRCQLLKIPVLSCTEMQRYFLVQYGKACNSKSTVIISKNHAADLIAYYATPQSRAGRLIIDQKTQSNRNNISHKVLRDSKYESKGSKKSSRSQSLSASKDLEKPFSPCIQKDTLKKGEISSTHCGKQKKHKKTKYLGILKSHKKEKSDSTVFKTSESVVKNASNQTCNKQSIKIPGKTKLRHYSKGDACKTCSCVHKKKSRKIRHIHKVERKHKKHGISDEIGTKLPTGIFSEIDSRESLGLSQRKKCQTVKRNVKSSSHSCRQKKGSSRDEERGLSAGSSITSTTINGSLRTLPVKHQAALSGSSVESQLPPQSADLCLDLFIRPDSACVHCATCSQYLSVAHFMRHHHVPSDCELLAAKRTQRILVPQNSKNMSKQEQHLWEEFQRLQKAVGGADDETDNESDECHSNQNMSALSKSPSSSRLRLDKSQYTHNKVKRQTLSRLSTASSHMRGDENSDSFWLNQKSLSPGIPSVSDNQKHSRKAYSKLITQDNTGVSQLLTESDAEVSSLRSSRDTSVGCARTSTRKRKSKQFFSIEKY